MSNTEQISALLRKLQGADHSERAQAAEALGKIGNPALPALLGVYDTANESVRIQVVAAMASIAGPEATNFLRKVLHDDKAGSLRGKAAKALLKRPDAREYHAEAQTFADRLFGSGKFQCHVCLRIGSKCVLYSADDFKRAVRKGFLPPEHCRWELAVDARPPKRDALGRKVEVISADFDALKRSVTDAEERAAMQKWKVDAQQRTEMALLCAKCDGDAREFYDPSNQEMTSKKWWQFWK